MATARGHRLRRGRGGNPACIRAGRRGGTTVYLTGADEGTDGAKFGAVWGSRLHWQPGPVGGGFWTVTADGSVTREGAAVFSGDLAAITLNQPVVGIAATPSGHGYWLVASDGGIFPFGDARFFRFDGFGAVESAGRRYGGDAVGHGYWLVASDGGIFPFGDARFFGSTGSVRLNQPVVGMAATPSGHGYWLVASDGGIFPLVMPGFRFDGGGALEPAGGGHDDEPDRPWLLVGRVRTAASSPSATPTSSDLEEGRDCRNRRSGWSTPTPKTAIGWPSPVGRSVPSAMPPTSSPDRPHVR